MVSKLALVAAVVFHGLGSLAIGKEEDVAWDHFIFAQTWSPSVCHVSNIEHPNSCLIPDHVDTWTIHGLWPSVSNSSKDPAFCHSSERHFNASAIESVVSKLKVEWPNLIVGQTVDSLWKHEWEKHGTCAMILPSLSDELKYFSHGLDFHDLFNIAQVLESRQILPTNTKNYQASDFQSALSSKFGESFSLHCVKSKFDDFWHVSEFRICTDKSFALIPCPPHHHGPEKFADNYLQRGVPVPELCPKDTQLVYPNFQNKKDRNVKSRRSFLLKLMPFLVFVLILYL